MNRSGRASLLFSLVLMALPAGAAPPKSDNPDFPHRPVRYIVAFPAGREP